MNDSSVVQHFRECVAALFVALNNLYVRARFYQLLSKVIRNLSAAQKNYIAAPADVEVSLFKELCGDFGLGYYRNFVACPDDEVAVSNINSAVALNGADPYLSAQVVDLAYLLVD